MNAEYTYTGKRKTNQKYKKKEGILYFFFII